MSASVHVQYRNTSEPLTQGSTDYCAFNSSVELDASWAKTQVSIAEAGTFKNLFIRIDTNNLSVTATYEIFKNDVASGVKVDIATTQTGTFEDTTNTIAFAVGDDCAWRASAPAGTGTCDAVVMGLEFKPDTGANANSVFGINSAGSSAHAADGTFFYNPQGQRKSSTTEAEGQFTLPLALTGKHLGLITGSNSRDGAVTCTARVNAVDGNMTVSVGASQTGFFEDTTNTDTITADDEFCWKVVIPTGAGTFNLEKITCNFLNTAGKSLLFVGTGGTGNSTNDGLTRYQGMAGENLNFSTETQTQYTPRLDIKLSNFSTKIGFNNTPASSVLRVRVNAVNGNQIVSLDANQTGTFVDSTNTDTITGGTDAINYQIVTSAGGTRIRSNWLGVEVEDNTPVAGGGLSGSLMLSGVGF